MPLLNTASKVYKGSQLVTSVYSNNKKVWPTTVTGPPTAVNVEQGKFTADTSVSKTITNVQPNEILIFSWDSNNERKMTFNTGSSTATGVQYIGNSISNQTGYAYVHAFTGPTTNGSVVFNCNPYQAGAGTYYYYRVRLNRPWNSCSGYEGASGTNLNFYQFPATHAHTFGIWTHTTYGLFTWPASITPITQDALTELSLFSGIFSGTGTSPLVSRNNTGSSGRNNELWFNFD